MTGFWKIKRFKRSRYCISRM